MNEEKKLEEVSGGMPTNEEISRLADAGSKFLSYNDCPTCTRFGPKTCPYFYQLGGALFKCQFRE